MRRQLVQIALGLMLAHQAVAGRGFAAEKPAALPGVVEFNRDIRPLLSDNCFACHGPDKNKREADLRLDTELGLLGKRTAPADKAGDKDPPTVVIPGKPEQSELWRRITTSDKDERMPPAEFAKVLEPRDLALIRRWIEQGAKWEGHWAFLPIKRPPPPKLDGTAAMANPIDAFVSQTLAEQTSHLQLKPAAAADRVTLIRRLSFDLTGLPPTPEQVDAFVADPSPRAYEAVVDRLLASPQFGERMAMWWLDLVRYADSVGYHGDQPVSIFPFRQYVIDSFNGNQPFDQFTLEQLAGDLLPNATLPQKIASGYNRLGMMSAEGGVQPKEYLAKYIAERVRNLSGTWLGVTLGCCECHDHKYDPFTSRDFYSLEAFFADIQERGLYSGAHASGEWGPSIKVPSPQQVSERDRLDRELAEAKTLLAAATPELAAAQAEWEKSQARWTPLKPESQTSAGGVTLTLLADGSTLASGLNPAKDTYTLVVKNPPAGVTAFKVEVLPDDSLPKKGPGRAGNGNFVLTEFVVKSKPNGDAPEQAVPLQNASATYEQIGAAKNTPSGKWTAAGAIDGDAKGASFGWAVMEQVGQPNAAVFETAADLPSGEGTTLTISLLQNHENSGHTLGRFRVSVTASPRPVRAQPLSLTQELAAILAVPPDQRPEPQRQALAAHYRTIAPALEPARAKVKQLEQARAELEKLVPTSLVTLAVAPRMVRILPRGNWMDDRGEPLSPAFPAILPQPSPSPASDQRLTRLDLARWVTSPDNPLTARAFVNRLWKLYFGAGLSRKIDDLGAQGDGPSHPLLLDWLAGQFIDSGWDVKQTVKQVVMSATYRQSSLTTAAMREHDPSNRWLARQGRFRLDAELVRDNALKISGLLVERLGGPSVRPYQPPGYWSYLNFPAREWQNGAGDELYRRGLYTHWQRQYLHPSLLAFDAPCREECTADRSRSNTPLQSLVLLNDPTYVEAARSFAEQILRQGGGTTAERLNFAFRRAVSRPAKPGEAAVLTRLLDEHHKEYQQDAAATTALLTIGARPTPTDLDKTDLAAWTSVARAILNLHETITRN